MQISGPVSVQIGSTIQLSATTLNDSDSGYSWSSADTSIATVDNTGLVTGVAAGETTITAKGNDTGKSATHGVVVLTEGGGGQAVVVVDVPTFQVTVGGTVQATASTVNATDASYTWTSNDENVATVDATGLVTGVAAGEAVITATGDTTGASGQVGIVVGTGGGVNPQDIPNYEAWAGSGHANATDAPFTHWDAEGTIPAACSRCHSTPGYVAYLEGNPSDEPTGTVITCQACHSAAAQQLSDVTYPSGAIVYDQGPSARCQACHQFRESTVSVREAIATAGATDTPDAVMTDQGFINSHYFGAGATLNGGLVLGGYEYADQSYDKRFQHVYVMNLDSCNGCHSPHSLEVQVQTCQTCHPQATDVAGTHDIRMIDSMAQDYDGDGNTTEGMYYEVQGLHDLLLSAMQGYTTAQSISAICYTPDSYPYFFVDTNGNGTCDSDETTAYDSWTPRLLEAAYNYQFVQKDPGAFAHNSKYVIQLMYDGISDLGGDVSTLVRNDPGHFNGADVPFTHWDGTYPLPPESPVATTPNSNLADSADPTSAQVQAFVEADCSKCHGGETGYRFWIDYGAHTEVPVQQQNGLQCMTCHADDATFQGAETATLLPLTSFTFEANGVEITDYTQQGDICATCHQGRSSTSTVNATIAAAAGAPMPATDIGIHYLAAAGNLFGTEAMIGYQFDGQTYAGRFPHTGTGDTNSCTYCHQPGNTNHTFLVADGDLSNCASCHGTTNLADFRKPFTTAIDYNGNGDTTEGLSSELASFADRLLTSMQAYATGTIGTSICYSLETYPYFFIDTDANGTCDATEAAFGNRYVAFDPTLLEAAYNYQFYEKEPGAWAHNFNYMGELLYDSISAVGGSTTDPTTLTRPDPATP